MNFRIIAYIVGWVCNFQAMFMVLPCITALIYQEHEFFAFLISMIVCLIVGLPLTIRKPKNKVFYTKDGCVAVALSWFALVFPVQYLLSSAVLSHIQSMLFLRQYLGSQQPDPVS